MKPLEKIYHRSGYTLTQELRTETHALYAKICNETKEIHAWEVFEIRKTEAHEAVIAGNLVKFEAKENFPKDEDFGISAFTYRVMSKALFKYTLLTTPCAQTDTISP